MIPVLRPICLECARYAVDAAGFLCEAFPGGIPEEIIFSRADHTRPYPGDNGLRFVPMDPERVGEKTRNPLLLAPAPSAASRVEVAE